MRAHVTKVESLGSYWFFDEDAKEYMRTPKTEGPRVTPPELAEVGVDWGGQNAGPLQDLVWQPYYRWEIEHRPLQDVLIIQYREDSTRGTIAPITESSQDLREAAQGNR